MPHYMVVMRQTRKSFELQYYKRKTYSIYNTPKLLIVIPEKSACPLTTWFKKYLK